MPYSITTQDGITIDNIPDHIPRDAPALKERVAKIRNGGSGKREPGATVQAPTNGYMMGLRDPVDGLAQLARRVVPEGIGQAVDNFGNKLADMGLPVARSNGVEGVDSIVNEVNQGYEAGRQQRAQGVASLVTQAPEEPGYDWGRLAGNLVNPVNLVAGPAMGAAKTLPQLAKLGAVAGAAGGAMQPVTGDTADFWQRKGLQVGAGAAVGAVATPAFARGAQTAGRAINAARQRAQPTINVDVAVHNLMRSQGVNPAEVTEEMMNSVRQQVEAATRARQRMDPAAILRQAQFEAVGLTGDAAPTLGQMTRDPIQFAQEKNLSGVVLKTPRGQGNPLSDRFQNQTNRLQSVFDQVGAQQATDATTAGDTLLGALRQYDEPVKAAVDGAYESARSMTAGRGAELDRGAFSQAANEALDRGMWGRFVPPEVRGLLNDITDGTTPFTVDAYVQVEGILSKAQRKAQRAGDDAGAAAVGVIRDALQRTPFAQRGAPGAAAAAGGQEAAQSMAGVVDNGIDDVAFREVMPTGLPGQQALPAPGSRALAPDMVFDMPPPAQQGTALGPVRAPQAQPVDEGAAAREAFDQARRAARNRFATIEDTPALKAALNDAAPDGFVRKFILGADVRDVESLRRVLENSPEALAQARAQVADHLKRAAFGSNLSRDGSFAPARYAETLRALGPQKLRVFFEPAEIVRLNLAAKVASDINSIPAGAKGAVNTSGTGAAIANMLSKLGDSSLLRKIPTVGRAVANQLGEMGTEMKINKALSGKPPVQPAQLSPETMRALQSLFPAVGTAAGAFGGMADK